MSSNALGSTSSDTPPKTASNPSQRMSRRLLLLLAVVAGASAANLYYAQPLLPTIADMLGVSDSLAGLLVTMSQIGYAVGLAFLVPLGDLLERRRLIVGLLAITAAALGLAAASPAFALLATAIAVIGVTSVTAQIAVPMAASLAADHERGRVMGTIMSGLLIGILTARMASGLIATLGGWRVVFATAAVAMLVLAVIVRAVLPSASPTVTLRYWALLRSVLELVRAQPVLRQRMVLGAAGMGCFTIVWTAIAFLLAGPAYGYGPAAIGLFSVAGLAGAAAAPLAGRFADRGHERLVTTVAFIGLLASWGLLFRGEDSVVLLIAGILLLDFAVQSLQITHQSAIYALSSTVHARVTSAFVISMFLGGAIASAATATVYAMAGWFGVCALGTGFAAFALAFWLTTERGQPVRRNGGHGIQPAAHHQ